MYVCPVCKTSLVDLSLQECPSCRLPYKYQNSRFTYNFDELLFKNFKQQFILNKVLNNNGYLSYNFLQEGSLSLPDRDDVQRFKQYIKDHSPLQGSEALSILDVGCGLLEIPGYLDFENRTRHTFFGIEPIKESRFFGNLITGCSEFMPLASDSIDIVIYATSLDHVCSLEQTLRETFRVLKNKGKVILWISDQSSSLWDKIYKKYMTLRRNYSAGYRTELYYVYPNYTVLEVPRGGVDPFHSHFESPEKIEKAFKKQGLDFEDQKYREKNEVFMTFYKP